MRSHPARAASLALIFVSILSGPQAVVAADFAWLQPMVEEVHAATGVVALAAAIVDSSGLRAEVAVGERRVGSGSPVQTGDRWHIASCSKAMTSALYARFVEQGRLRFDSTLPELFPDLAAEMAPVWSSVTAEHLLAHRAGIGDVGVIWWLRAHAASGTVQEQRVAEARRILRGAPAHPVGEYRYSNLGYMLVAAALEEHVGDGRSWEEILVQELWDPLGGADGFGYGPPRGEAPEGHQRRFFGLGGWVPVGQGRLADNPPVFGPAGTAHLTFQRWAVFVREMLGGESLLRAETTQHLLAPFPDEDSGYALGWEVSEGGEAGSGVRRHDGSNRFWKSRQVLWPQDGVAALMATNQAGSAAEAAMDQLTERIRAALSGAR